MGREQDLLEAARSGNVSVIEKILTPRKKMTVGNIPLSLGPFQSLRRAPNPNCHDQNGDTPLHLAALNGHIAAVKILLGHEASANVMDYKGCYPLHLAAWSGNAEMCLVLLSHGPSIAQVNEQNQVGETALHCSAQYGHTEVVAVLIQHVGDASIRNHVCESPLDLASQYGRLDTVELLVRKHPALIHQKTEDQSPLHLASRNGHRQVVQVLLDAGHSINKTTEAGSALHEAAVFGKQDVVRLLLKRGIDVSLTDSARRTPLEILSEQKSQLALDIGRIILDYQEGRSISDHRSSTLSTCSDLLEEPLYDNPVICRRSCISESDTHERRPVSARSSADSSVFGATGGVTGGNTRLSSCSEGYFIYDTPRSRPIPIGLEEVDSASDTSDTAHSLPGATSLSQSSGIYIPQCNIGAPLSRSSLGTSLPSTPETPKKPPRRKLPSSVKKSKPGHRISPPKMVFMNKRSSTASRESGSDSDKAIDKTTDKTVTMKETNGNSSANDNLAMSLTFSDDACDNVTNANIRQRNSLRHSADVVNSNHQEATVINSQTHILCRERHSAFENNNISVLDTKNERHTVAVDNGEYLHGSLDGGGVVYRSSVTRPKSTATSTARVLPGQELTDIVMGTGPSKPDDSPVITPSSRPPSLDFSSKRSSAEVPLSPTGYQQPPTPDHPPPSPMTAVLGIHEKINPKDKRRSRDMETITEAAFLLIGPEATSDQRPQSTTTGPLAESVAESYSQDGSTASASPLSQSPEGASILRKKKRSDSEELMIIANGTNPFIGLTKGAIPKDQRRRVKSQIFDSLPHIIARSKKRISAPGLYTTFDPLMEGEEGAVKDMIQSPAGVRVSVRRRSFVDGEPVEGTEDENEEWAKIAAILSSCGGRMSASEYSDYDDFERRLQKIFAEEKRGAIMQSIGDWLDKLGLPQYENTLVANGFDDIDFLGPNVLEEQDLVEMGIIKNTHQVTILAASSQLKPVKPIVEGDSPSSVEQWLQSLHLSDYLDTFHANNFTSMDRIRNIWELELNSVLDITTLGHRKRILASLRVPSDADAVSQSEDFMDFTKDWRETTEEQIDELANLNLFKDYTNVRPRRRKDDNDHHEGEPPTQEDTDHCELCEQEANGVQVDCEDSAVQIRPPNPSSAENTTIKQWRHQPEVLIKGCCNYTVQYLGSTLVKSLQGTESTRESIHKMKRPHIEKNNKYSQKSSDSIAKVPSVVLSISYRGVKFIDARSKHVICEHDISNIFCACQDGENLNYFAYITRDHVTERHYCHVFCVRSTELATEIILTLGEAFEVAYQVAIRERIIEEEEEEEEEEEGDTSYDDQECTNIVSQQVEPQSQENIENGQESLGAAAAPISS